MAERLHTSECPVSLSWSRGPNFNAMSSDEAAHIVESVAFGFDGGRGYGEWVRDITTTATVASFQRSGAFATPAPTWRVDALNVSSDGTPRIVRSLVILPLSPEHIFPPEEGPDPVEVVFHPEPLDTPVFTMFVTTWLTDLLPPIERLENQKVAALTALVEVLLRHLDVLVMHNRELHTRLAESELVVQQLQAQIDTLNAEKLSDYHDDEVAKASAGVVKKVFEKVGVIGVAAIISASGTVALAAEGAVSSPGSHTVDITNVIVNDCNNILNFQGGTRTFSGAAGREGDGVSHARGEGATPP